MRAVAYILCGLLVLAVLLDVRDQPSPQDLRNDTAGLLLDEARWGEAAAAFQDLYAEGYGHAALGWGIALRGQGRLEESLWCLEELGPSEDLAFTLYALDRNLDAAGVFGQLLDEDPLSVWNLAAALDSAGKTTESLVWDVASRLTPHDGLWPDVLLALARAAFERGELEHAGAVLAQVDDLMEQGETDGR